MAYVIINKTSDTETFGDYNSTKKEHKVNWSFSLRFFIFYSVSYTAPKSVQQQYEDNAKWIREAGRHKMV